MTQQFVTQNFKTKNSVLLFGKSWAAPLVLYFDNPQEKYKEIQEVINSSNQPKLLELVANGPIKKVCILSSQIAGVALQEEQHLA